MYSGPEHGVVDNYFLSRILFYLSKYVPKGTKICLIGGSALMALGIRKTGSEDVDLIALNHSVEFSDAIKRINRKIRNKELFIEITKDQQVIEKFQLPTEVIVQNFNEYLPSVKLTELFFDRVHRIRKFKWVMPEGGVKKTFRSSTLFPHCEIYVLNLQDLFCAKLYAGREKDRKDIREMLHGNARTRRYFMTHNASLLQALEKYMEVNKAKSEYVGKLYDYFQKEYSHVLLPRDVKKD